MTLRRFALLSSLVLAPLLASGCNATTSTPEPAATQPAASAEHDSTASADYIARHHHLVANAESEMGFSQEKTTHHFVLLPNGGRIQVTANDAADDESIAKVRGHLKMIAEAFSEGDFAAPESVHGREPSGVAVMKRMKEQIEFSYDNLPAGGAIAIDSDDSEAVEAIHEFLRFQIKDHGTGDPLEVSEPATVKL